MNRCVIFLGESGMFPDLAEGDVVICADSGLRPVIKAGRAPQYVIGDMDSVTIGELENAERLGARIMRFPPDKDRTDGELAVELGLSLKPDSLVLVGGYSGRTDHILSTFLLLRSVPASIKCELLMEGDKVMLVRKGGKADCRSGYSVVSLIPLGGDCIVTTVGLRWELRRDTLQDGTTKGIHNEPIVGEFSIEVHEGEMFLVLSGRERS